VGLGRHGSGACLAAPKLVVVGRRPAGVPRRRSHPGHAAAPWHFLYFFPLPHGQGSLRPTFGSSRRTCLIGASSPPTRGGGCGPLDRAGAAVFGAGERGAPNTDDAADSAPGLFMTSGCRRGAGAGRRAGGGATASSAITGRSHHRYRTISSSTRSFIAWKRSK